MTDNTPDNGQIKFKLHWQTADNAPSVYATHFYVTYTGREFYLIVGEAQIPILAGISDDEMPSEIDVKPIAKIVVSDEAMAEFIQILNSNYGRVLTQFGVTDTEAEE